MKVLKNFYSLKTGKKYFKGQEFDGEVTQKLIDLGLIEKPKVTEKKEEKKEVVTKELKTRNRRTKTAK